MNILNKKLAQDIADRTMAIIGRNINVMDEKGVIIGSGDPKRVDHIHEGAELAIRNGTGVEVDEAEAGKLHGALPGINLPIRFHGGIVGVIGITGPPDEIRSYAELVRMAAELSFEQEVLIRQVQWDERLMEELVSQIIHFSGTADPIFYERARRLGIDLEVPRIACVLQTEDRQKTLTLIKSQLGKEDLTLVQPSHVVLLIKSDRPRHKLSKMAASWIELMNKRNLTGKISIGSDGPGLSGIAESYSLAVKTLNAGIRLRPSQNVYNYEDFQLPVLLLAAREQDLPGLTSYYSLLTGNDKKGELAETLEAFIEHDGEMNSVASKLFIHRNTLKYRLDRITEITGKDPRKISELIPLYISMLYEKMN